MTISGRTRVFGVVGQPVVQSLSPALHNAWYADHGLDAVYVALPLAATTAEAVFRQFVALGVAGMNVTSPFKEDAARAATKLDPNAKVLQAVNTLAVRGDQLWGFNTDAPGFVAALNEAAPDWLGTVKAAVVLGAGGAGRAIALGLEQAGVDQIILVNRDPVKGKAAAASLGLEFWAIDRFVEAFATGDLIVNATTLGMGGGGPDWPVAAAKAGAIIVDAVYSPLETRLLAAARARGLVCVDGLGMLIHQGALAFEHWFGLRPDTRKARERLILAIAERGG